MKLISSTTDYNHQPQLGQGTAIFYLQLAISGGTKFGENVSAGGGLTGQQIVPGQPYTAYGRASVSGFHVNFGPCYAVATKGKYGGVIGGIGTLLKGVRRARGGERYYRNLLREPDQQEVLGDGAG